MRPRREHERGQALPLMAIVLSAVLAMIALVVDGGYWRYQLRLEQAAADSAAIAGDIQLYYPTAPMPPGSTAPAEVVSAADKAASDNGFPQGGTGDTMVSVYSPPRNDAPPYPGATPYPANSAVEVVIRRKQPVFFAGIFGGEDRYVSARAVAVHQPNSGYCLYQLDPNGSLAMSPPGDTSAVPCSIAVNGSIPSGSVAAQGLWYSGVPPQADLVPPLVAKKAFPITDPCLTIAGCAFLQREPFSPQSTAADAASLSNLTPGAYINCCQNSVSLSPGIYYFYGGISSGSLTGTGVTVVNVDGATRFNGSGGMNITAPEDGPTAGVAFYQPPDNSNDFRSDGNPGQFAGLFYAPSASYTTHGDGDTFLSAVVGSLKFTGAKSLVVDRNIGSTTIRREAEATGAVLSE